MPTALRGAMESSPSPPQFLCEQQGHLIYTCPKVDSVNEPSIGNP